MPGIEQQQSRKLTAARATICLFANITYVLSGREDKRFGEPNAYGWSTMFQDYTPGKMSAARVNLFCTAYKQMSYVSKQTS